MLVSISVYGMPIRAGGFMQPPESARASAPRPPAGPPATATAAAANRPKQTCGPAPSLTRARDPRETTAGALLMVGRP